MKICIYIDDGFPKNIGGVFRLTKIDKKLYWEYVSSTGQLFISKELVYSQFGCLTSIHRHFSNRIQLSPEDPWLYEFHEEDLRGLKIHESQ